MTLVNGDIVGFEAFELEQLRVPRDWRDLVGEAPEVTQEKIRLAHQLGLAAMLFTPGEVKERTHEMAQVEHANILARTVPGQLDKSNLYIGILNGAAPFGGKLFDTIGGLEPFVHSNVGYARKSRYEEGLFGSKADKEVRDLIDDKTLAVIKHAIYFDEVREEGITIEQVHDHTQNRWQRLTGGLILPKSCIVLCDKDMADGVTTFAPENTLIGFKVPVPWASCTGMDSNGAFRWAPGLALSNVQLESNRDLLPEILDTLGERAVIDIDGFTFI